MDRPLTINLGQQEHVLPSIEGCLKDFDGKFYSSSNAIRIYEWMGSTEVIPPSIEAVRKDADGTLQLRRLGFHGNAIYPTQIQPGWLLEVEQLVLARNEMSQLLFDSIDHAKMLQERSNSAEEGKALMETTSKIMAKMCEISYFNANCMFSATPFPKRLAYEGIQVLDYLVQMVITERDKVIYHTDQQSPADWPEQLFNKMELDRIIGSIHQAEAMGCFLDPEKMVLFYNLLDASFYRQCAMAFSMCAGVPIPRAYVEPELTKVFFWAQKVLNSVKVSIPSLKVRPKPKNVVNLFKTN